MFSDKSFFQKSLQHSINNPICWLILHVCLFFVVVVRRRRVEEAGKGKKNLKKSRIQRIKSALQASSLVPLPLAHLVLSKELDVEAAVSQFWILLNRKYIVAIVALYFT